MSVPPTSPTHRAKSRVTRRAVIGAVGAVAAGAVITPTVMATTGDSGDPTAADTGAEDTKAGTTTETFPKTRSEAATGEAPVEAAFPIGYVGVPGAAPTRSQAAPSGCGTPTAARANGSPSATAAARWPTAAAC